MAQSVMLICPGFPKTMDISLQIVNFEIEGKGWLLHVPEK